MFADAMHLGSHTRQDNRNNLGTEEARADFARFCLKDSARNCIQERPQVSIALSAGVCERASFAHFLARKLIARASAAISYAASRDTALHSFASNRRDDGSLLRRSARPASRHPDRTGQSIQPSDIDPACCTARIRAARLPQESLSAEPHR